MLTTCYDINLLIVSKLDCRDIVGLVGLNREWKAFIENCPLYNDLLRLNKQAQGGRPKLTYLAASEGNVGLLNLVGLHMPSKLLFPVAARNGHIGVLNWLISLTSPGKLTSWGTQIIVEAIKGAQVGVLDWWAKSPYFTPVKAWYIKPDVEKYASPEMLDWWMLNGRRCLIDGGGLMNGPGSEPISTSKLTFNGQASKPMDENTLIDKVNLARAMVDNNNPVIAWYLESGLPFDIGAMKRQLSSLCRSKNIEGLNIILDRIDVGIEVVNLACELGELCLFTLFPEDDIPYDENTIQNASMSKKSAEVLSYLKPRLFMKDSFGRAMSGLEKGCIVHLDNMNIGALKWWEAEAKAPWVKASKIRFRYATKAIDKAFSSNTQVFYWWISQKTFKAKMPTNLFNDVFSDVPMDAFLYLIETGMPIKFHAFKLDIIDIGKLNWLTDNYLSKGLPLDETTGIESINESILALATEMRANTKVLDWWYNARHLKWPGDQQIDLNYAFTYYAWKARQITGDCKAVEEILNWWSQRYLDYFAWRALGENTGTRTGEKPCVGTCKSVPKEIRGCKPYITRVCLNETYKINWWASLLKEAGVKNYYIPAMKQVIQAASSNYDTELIECALEAAEEIQFPDVNEAMHDLCRDNNVYMAKWWFSGAKKRGLDKLPPETLQALRNQFGDGPWVAGNV